MTRQETTNTFSKGLVVDLNPITTPNSVLTSALNGTFITFNGNEYMLQNDMGNGRVESAYLPPGYVPLGSTEYGGIIYIASHNPLTGKSLIGCFPSPEQNIDLEDVEKTLKTLNLNNLGTSVFDSNQAIFPIGTVIRSGDKFSVLVDGLFTPSVINTIKNSTVTNTYTGDTYDIIDIANYNSLYDKFTKAISGFNNIGFLDGITNYENEDNIRVKSPKNKAYSLSVCLLDNNGNLLDITSSMKRFIYDITTIKEYYNKLAELQLQFIVDETISETEYLTQYKILLEDYSDIFNATQLKTYKNLLKKLNAGTFLLPYQINITDDACANIDAYRKNVNTAVNVYNNKIFGNLYLTAKVNTPEFVNTTIAAYKGPMSVEDLSFYGDSDINTTYYKVTITSDSSNIYDLPIYTKDLGYTIINLIPNSDIITCAKNSDSFELDFSNLDNPNYFSIVNLDSKYYTKNNKSFVNSEATITSCPFYLDSSNNIHAKPIVVINSYWNSYSYGKNTSKQIYNISDSHDTGEIKLTFTNTKRTNNSEETNYLSSNFKQVSTTFPISELLSSLTDKITVPVTRKITKVLFNEGVLTIYYEYSSFGGSTNIIPEVSSVTGSYVLDLNTSDFASLHTLTSTNDFVVTKISDITSSILYEDSTSKVEQQTFDLTIIPTEKTFYTLNYIFEEGSYSNVATALNQEKLVYTYQFDIQITGDNFTYSYETDSSAAYLENDKLILLLFNTEWQYNCPDGIFDTKDSKVITQYSQLFLETYKYVNGLEEDFYPTKTINGLNIDTYELSSGQLLEFNVTFNPDGTWTNTYDENTNLYKVNLKYYYMIDNADTNKHKYTITPVILGNKYTDLGQEFVIDFNLINSGLLRTNIWRYFLDDNYVLTLNYGFESYPILNTIIDNMTFEFIDLEKLADWGSYEQYKTNEDIYTLLVEPKDSFNGSFYETLDNCLNLRTFYLVKIVATIINKDKRDESGKYITTKKLVDYKPLLYSLYFNKYYETISDFSQMLEFKSVDSKGKSYTESYNLTQNLDLNISTSISSEYTATDLELEGATLNNTLVSNLLENSNKVIRRYVGIDNKELNPITSIGDNPYWFPFDIDTENLSPTVTYTENKFITSTNAYNKVSQGNYLNESPYEVKTPFTIDNNGYINYALEEWLISPIRLCTFDITPSYTSLSKLLVSQESNLYNNISNLYYVSAWVSAEEITGRGDRHQAVAKFFNSLAASEQEKQFHECRSDATLNWDDSENMRSVMCSALPGGGILNISEHPCNWSETRTHGTKVVSSLVGDIPFVMDGDNTLPVLLPEYLNNSKEFLQLLLNLYVKCPDDYDNSAEHYSGKYWMHVFTRELNNNISTSDSAKIIGKQDTTLTKDSFGYCYCKDNKHLYNYIITTTVNTLNIDNYNNKYLKALEILIALDCNTFNLNHTSLEASKESIVKQINIAGDTIEEKINNLYNNFKFSIKTEYNLEVCLTLNIPGLDTLYLLASALANVDTRKLSGGISFVATDGIPVILTTANKIDGLNYTETSEDGTTTKDLEFIGYYKNKFYVGVKKIPDTIKDKVLYSLLLEWFCKDFIYDSTYSKNDYLYWDGAASTVLLETSLFAGGSSDSDTNETFTLDSTNHKYTFWK